MGNCLDQFWWDDGLLIKCGGHGVDGHSGVPEGHKWACGDALVLGDVDGGGDAGVVLVEGCDSGIRCAVRGEL